MGYYNKTANETLAQLGSDAHAGLTKSQVAENAAKYGKNEFTRTKPKSLLRRIWEASTEPMLILLFFASFFCFLRG